MLGVCLPQPPLLFKDGNLKKECERGAGRCVFGSGAGISKADGVRRKKNP